jgi:hypothetical protein
MIFEFFLKNKFFICCLNINLHKKIQVHWLQFAKDMANHNLEIASVTQNSTSVSCIRPNVVAKAMWWPSNPLGINPWLSMEWRNFLLSKRLDICPTQSTIVQMEQCNPTLKFLEVILRDLIHSNWRVCFQLIKYLVKRPNLE